MDLFSRSRVAGFIVISTVVQFAASSRLADFNDAHSYRTLAISLRSGVYTQWPDLSPPPPDTFRSPGYPLFLSMLPLSSDLAWIHSVAQLILILVALWLTTRVLTHQGHDSAVPVLVGLFALSPQFPFFAAATAPETLMAFLVAAWIHESVHNDRPAVSGALWGGMALVRPTFLLFPFAYWCLAAYRTRTWAKRELTMAAVMILALAPYGLWNLKMHGVLSVTPIEGGAPNAHDGFWQLRLPGYTSFRYFNGSFMGDEPIEFVSPADRGRYIGLYEAEWDQIDGLVPMSAEDRRRQQVMMNRSCFPTYTSEYVLKRSRAISTAILSDVKHEPGYYLASRAYTAIRLWIPAPNVREMASASVTRRLRGLLPTVIAILVFLGGGLVLGQQVVRNPAAFSGLSSAAIVVVYWWIIHIPFSIQARYMLPVHLPVLALIAVAIRSRLGPNRGGEGPVG